MVSRALVVALITSVCFASQAFAASWSDPHPHKGELQKYKGKPPTVKVSDADKTKLKAGEPVYKTIKSKKGGRGVAVFYVNASVDKVWKTIGNYKRYPKYVGEVKRTRVYGKTDKGSKVWFEVESWGVKVEYFIDHVENDAEKWVTWHLDYSKESDLGDSVGFWQLKKVDDKTTQVAYSVDLTTRGWVPGFIKTMLVDNGLKTATSWVKVHSEKK